MWNFLMEGHSKKVALQRQNEMDHIKKMMSDDSEIQVRLSRAAAIFSLIIVCVLQRFRQQSGSVLEENQPLYYAIAIINVLAAYGIVLVWVTADDPRFAVVRRYSLIFSIVFIALAVSILVFALSVESSRSFSPVIKLWQIDKGERFSQYLL